MLGAERENTPASKHNRARIAQHSVRQCSTYQPACWQREGDVQYAIKLKESSLQTRNRPNNTKRYCNIVFRSASLIKNEWNDGMSAAAMWCVSDTWLVRFAWACVECGRSSKGRVPHAYHSYSRKKWAAGTIIHCQGLNLPLAPFLEASENSCGWVTPS